MIPAERGEKAIEALRLLSSAAALGDFIYDAWEREGQGWDGPLVKVWSDGSMLAARVLKGADATGVP